MSRPKYKLFEFNFELFSNISKTDKKVLLLILLKAKKARENLQWLRGPHGEIEKEILDIRNSLCKYRRVWVHEGERKGCCKTDREAMLCYAMVCYKMYAACYAVSWYAILCCRMLAVVCYAVLSCVCCDMLCYAVLS